jgi:hypothetical protein
MASRADYVWEPLEDIVEPDILENKVRGGWSA